MGKLQTLAELIEYNLDLINQSRSEEVTLTHSIIAIFVVLTVALFSNSIIGAITGVLYLLIAYIIYPILWLKPSSDVIRRVHRVLMLLKISEIYYKENKKDELILENVIKKYHKNYIRNKPFKRKEQKEFLNFLESELYCFFKKFSPE